MVKRRKNKEEGNSHSDPDISTEEDSPSNKMAKSKQKKQSLKLDRKRRNQTTPRKIKNKRCKKQVEEPEEEVSEDEQIEDTSHSGSNEIDEDPDTVVTVRFREEDNEYVEMQVENDLEDFPGEMDEENSEDEMEEGEISFNNNASRTTRQQGSSVTQDQGKVKKVEEPKLSEEDREARIVSKTVEKLKEIFTSGGYLVKGVQQTNQEKRQKDKEKDEEGKKKTKENLRKFEV